MGVMIDDEEKQEDRPGLIKKCYLVERRLQETMRLKGHHRDRKDTEVVKSMTRGAEDWITGTHNRAVKENLIQQGTQSL